MAQSLLSLPRFRFIFFGSWLAWALLHALVVHNFGGSWQSAVLDSITANTLLLAIGLLLMNTLRYYVPQKNRYSLLMVWVLLFSLFWLLLCRIALQLVLPQNDFLLLVKSSLYIRFSIGFLVTGNLVLISVLWYYWQEQKEMEARRTEANQLAREAELFKLRQQLQPHFLFNSLNSINALIGSRPAQARTMVLQLSDFLRGTLKKEEQQWVSLAEEMEYLGLYLDIEKVRFGHRLSTRIQVADEAQQLLLPTLLLQPVVENAIKFGLYDTLEPVTIEIDAAIKDNSLVVSVRNPFDPETNHPGGTGFGLKSVARRLYLLFGRHDLLSTQAADHTFTVSLTVPQIHQNRS